MNDTSMERQEILCHECKNYIQFELDLGLDGMHEFKCPKCGHMHYRIVKDGEITEDRYALDPSHYEDRRQYYDTHGSLFDTTVSGTTTNSVYYSGYNTASSTDTASDFLRQAWFDRSDSAGGYY